MMNISSGPQKEGILTSSRDLINSEIWIFLSTTVDPLLRAIFLQQPLFSPVIHAFNLVLISLQQPPLVIKRILIIVPTVKSTSPQWPLDQRLTNAVCKTPVLVLFSSIRTFKLLTEE